MLEVTFVTERHHPLYFVWSREVNLMLDVTSSDRLSSWMHRFICDRQVTPALLVLCFGQVAPPRQCSEVCDGHVGGTVWNLPAEISHEPNLDCLLRHCHPVPVHVGHFHGLGPGAMVSNSCPIYVPEMTVDDDYVAWRTSSSLEVEVGPLLDCLGPLDTRRRMMYDSGSSPLKRPIKT